ncbi:hypothetical protein D9757_005623 [Collybiopsis confluens]|uniref:Core domain-containing protein n=1 Tax=Collybiopsis confluens TaxID=2823264 RepID=A0A8H5HSJ3_9AGAR|nr:hypothetical protein D9757_005623 [Collybiopsis confluens]
MASRVSSRALRHLSRSLTRKTHLNLDQLNFWNPSTRICAYSATAPHRTTVTQHLPASPTVLLSLPSTDYLEQEEIDVELLPPEDAKIVITDRAAEQLQKISEREKDSNAALRIAVESGGCHGYQYRMELAKNRSLDDYHFTHPNIKPSNIVVDAVSLTLLNGSTIDFATELIGSSFRVSDNPHSKGSGCGCGVSWELKT